MKEPKATLKIFSTGSVTVTGILSLNQYSMEQTIFSIIKYVCNNISAPNVAAVQAAIEYIYPLVYEFRKERSVEDKLAVETKKRRITRKRNREEFLRDTDLLYDPMFSPSSSSIDEEGDSDASWD